MERTSQFCGSAATRGCSAVCRFLKQAGAQLLGVPELAEATTNTPWWGDASGVARQSAPRMQMNGAIAKPRQVEFWIDNDLKVSAEEKRAEAKAAPVVEPKEELPASQPEPMRIPEKMVLTQRAQPKAEKKTGGARLDRGALKSILGGSKFLSISGSVSDGRERGRWLALPGRRNGPRYKLMQMPSGAPVGLKEIRSLPHNFGLASR